MNYLELAINLMDFATSSPRKRHITGGLLMSMALLFGGLGFTVMTVGKKEEMEDKKNYE